MVAGDRNRKRGMVSCINKHKPIPESISPADSIPDSIVKLNVSSHVACSLAFLDNLKHYSSLDILKSLVMQISGGLLISDTVYVHLS